MNAYPEIQNQVGHYHLYVSSLAHYGFLKLTSGSSYSNISAASIVADSFSPFTSLEVEILSR